MSGGARPPGRGPGRRAPGRARRAARARRRARAAADAGASGPARRRDPVHQQEVEVDRARPVARPVARAPELPLDLEQRGEERCRRRARCRSRRRALRNGGWSRKPTGSVSRNDETATTSISGLARRAARGARQRRRAVAEVRLRARRTRDPQRKLNLASATRVRAQTRTTSAMRRRARQRAAAVAVLASLPPRPPRARRTTLVELAAGRRCTEAVFLRAAGGRRRRARARSLLRSRRAAARGVVPALRRARRRSGSARRTAGRGSLAVAGLRRPARADRVVAGRDRRRHAHAAAARAGPVTIVDSGIDVYAPGVRRARPNTETLNPQEPAGDRRRARNGGRIPRSARPRTASGVVGIYPEAVLRSWDAAPRRRARSSTTSEIVQGILAAASAGPGVDQPQPRLAPSRSSLIEQAIYDAVRKGTLIVAAAGQRRRPRQSRSAIPPTRPRADGRRDRPSRTRRRRSRAAPATSTSPRPASDIPVATALDNGWTGRRRDELRGTARLRRRRVGLDGCGPSSTRRSSSR